MDKITINDLKSLSEVQGKICVSIFLPTHRAGKETEQDPIRFKNLLREVEKQLLDDGVRRPEVEKFLSPAEELLIESGFWRQQSEGLAVFISHDHFYTFRLPVRFDELIVISSSFHLKPLLPFFAKDGHFYVLALSQNQIRLLEGTRHTVDEIDTEETLPNLAKAMEYERYHKDLQFHTGTAARQSGESAAMFHGHDPSDDDKKRILRWFHKVDEALSTVFSDEKSPLVLIGVDYLIPLYKQANSYPHLIELAVYGNPEELSAAEIHNKTWTLIVPRFTEDEEIAYRKYHELKNQNRTARTIDEILFAAHHGRVDSLFVATGEQIWGYYDLAKQILEVHHEHQTGDHDLLNVAAIQTILNGGTVYAVDFEKVPDGTLLAAIFRY
ncbi:MAG: hypothetical protein CVU40_09370 [Chloroflexi bacterium HGW-Chloroflexi-2]|jgi:hypothetical protein|nr:MAG: hypothetical protein CVU40_09370 [Chloroflexi bacterium HGW-Chloroflexi-2]